MRVRRQEGDARQVTVDNMAMLEVWCNGAIKGIRLPPEDRVIEFYNPAGDQRAEVGDWIINEGGYYSAVTDRVFSLLYERV